MFQMNCWCPLRWRKSPNSLPTTLLWMWPKLLLPSKPDRLPSIPRRKVRNPRKRKLPLKTLPRSKKFLLRNPRSPKAPKRVIGDDDLLIPDCEDMSVETFMASLRSGNGLEVFSLDDQGNMSTVPGYETEETLPDDTQFVDSADNHFAVLQKLGEIDSEDTEPKPEAEEAAPRSGCPDEGY